MPIIISYSRCQRTSDWLCMHAPLSVSIFIRNMTIFVFIRLFYLVCFSVLFFFFFTFNFIRKINSIHRQLFSPNGLIDIIVTVFKIMLMADFNFHPSIGRLSFTYIRYFPFILFAFVSSFVCLFCATR